MSLVSSVDYANKRIYLSAESAVSGTTLDTLDVYREVLALRKITLAHRHYLPIISASGNEPKITGLSYTAAAAKLLRGCRIIPYNGSHTITLVRDTYTDDGFANAGCFDLSSLSVGVEINIVVDYDKVEIRQLGSTPSEIASVTVAQLQSTTIPVDIAKVNGLTVTGSGTEEYPWGPVV
ncbi:hypothetical protein UFOVP1309_23 [uncultured Caudovirales phage]|uniref:Uncharacterized protein n=1 Tax=uncultured Caudovirales phage TaxID=2100421 RepID=A0A6J5RTE5_9CAUD|nr:hypothetical protein UFOVP1309_23 [uncultured Caudovirales phage]